jgi:subtilisin family serine protease
VTYHYGGVTQSYATGAVTAGANSTVGGLVGNNVANTVTNSYWDTYTTGQQYAFGDKTSTGAAAVTSDPGQSSASNYAYTQSAYGNFDFTNDWFMINGQTRPFGQWEYSTNIANAHQLQLMELNPSASYTLANNIDLGPDLANPSSMWGSAGFVPIAAYGGNFTGTFQGQGNKISNLTMAPTAANMQTVGLFGTIGQGGQVSNLTLSNVSITADASFTQGNDSEFIGALAGQNGGQISNVTVGGISSINGGTLAGVTAGGLVGQNWQTITGSQAAVSITLGDGVACNGNSCTGPQNAAGGLVGWNAGTIASSSASGSIVVGSNATAGGLVGQNGNWDSNNNPIAASIANSSASGAVSSAGVNVQIGGLVGENNPLSLITNSQAYGDVKSTAILSPNNNDCSTNCQYVNVGGFVGQNLGTISGTAWTTAPTVPCGPGYTCASGSVAVGQLGQGGGFVGQNQGVISYAFATGNVTGAAGLPDTATGNVFNNQTQIGGFAGENQGQISNSFASGAVGTAGTAYLQAGGFAAGNEGTIANSFATGAVQTGDSSTAGGFVSSNSPNKSGENCTGCYVGDGYNNTAAITYSQAYGNVTVGASSIAGGFAATTGDPNDAVGSLANVTASGAVNAGHDSIVGGLVGALFGSLSNSSAQNTIVASLGANSIVGGVAGFNGGSISNTTSSAPVSGTSDSFIGGITGINFGSVTGSTADPAVSGSGTSNFIGGIAGLNVGTISGSNATNLVLTSDSSSYAGGVAGVNGTFTNETVTIPNSSFPAGTFPNSSATGSGFSASVGTTTPAWSPGLPSWLTDASNCPVCSILTGGTLQAVAASTPPPPPPPPQAPPPPSSPPVNDNPQAVPQFVNNLVGYVTLASLSTGEVINTQTPNQPPQSPRSGGPGPAPGPGGLTPQFGSRFFTPPPAGETRYVQNEVVLQIPADIPAAELQALFGRLGVTVLGTESLDLLGVTTYRVGIGTGSTVTSVIQAAAGYQASHACQHEDHEHPLTSCTIAGAQPNYSYRLGQDDAPAAAPELAQDPELSGRTQEGDAAQYALGKLGLRGIHRLVKGNNITVAVIDSEIDLNHAELRGAILDQYDAVGAEDKPHSHGTGMAGAIVAHRRLMGIAPSAQLYAIHAFSSRAATAESTTFNIIRGLNWAVAKGVRVINMSFTGPRDPSMERALRAAHDRGIVLIAAAGNDGPKSPPLYPAADPNVIAVTATDRNDKVFPGANRGRYIAVAAPGVDIAVPAPDGAYQLTTGTSVASAEVSGIVALLLERNPNLTPDDIRSILTSSAKHPGTKQRDDIYGSGLVDPAKAIQAATAPGRPPADRAPATGTVRQSDVRD